MPIEREKLNKKNKSKKIELNVAVEDFGPITEGKITLKPLTLFIGPNNSGKSYTAMLIHSIFESYTPTSLPEGLPFFMRQRFRREDLDSRTFLKEFPELKGQIDDLKERGEFEISKQITNKITNKLFEEIYERQFSNEIVRSYACPLNELIRIGTSSFAIKISFNSYSTHLIYQKDKLKIKEYPQLDIKTRIKVIESFDTAISAITVQQSEDEILIGIPTIREEKEGKKFIPLSLIDLILDVYASKILKNVAMPCYYLPAARSGILQGHKALAAGIVKKAPYAGLERLEIPRFSGVVSDFISSVLTLPERKGTFYKLAQDFEEELIKGEIVVRTLDEYFYPEIKYNFQKTEISLHRASSTVSELAPLFLYLKYNIEPGSILIIEEPEAHLHPENQRILAKYLIRLIRRGVYITITTHSEYLLEQLSSFLLLSKVEPQKRVERYKYTEEDFLKSDESRCLCV